MAISHYFTFILACCIGFNNDWGLISPKKLRSALKFVDVHIHLSDPEYENKVDNILVIARRTGVVAMVSNSTNFQTSRVSLELAEKYPDLVYSAAGIHPWNANQLTSSELQETANLVLKNVTLRDKIIAIGEVGLDPKYAKRKEQKEQQLRVFTEMIQLAERCALPVIIHSRWSAHRILNLLPSYRLRGVLWHWFSDSSEILSRIVERGDYISEGPPVCYSGTIQEIVRQVPLEHLLTETDGPVRYYGPLKDTPTTPALISQTVKAISQVKKIDQLYAAKQILNNFSEFFSIQLQDSSAI